MYLTFDLFDVIIAGFIVLVFGYAFVYAGCLWIKNKFKNWRKK